MLKNELRISQENEKRIQSLLNSKQEHIIHLEKILSRFSEEREKNMKLNQENVKLKEEVERNVKKYNEEQEKWDRIKRDLMENYENELKSTKEAAKEEVFYLRTDIAKLNETNASTIECLKNELQKKEEDCKHTISQTISTYEEKLSKMNGDLASAQTEIKLLRERCAANMNLFNNMEIGKFVVEPHEDRNILSKPRFEPLPIVTRHSQIVRDRSYSPIKTHSSAQQEQQVNNKTKLTTVKKRKLYNHNDVLL
ncbi:uncharacterized protein isoform X2 [Rhodnius prolixus]